MAARGSVSKETITAKIMEVFPNAFKYEKELRVPMEEDGERVEIKIVMTCAKTNVGGEADSATLTQSGEIQTESREMTEEEKQNVVDLMAALGL